MGKRVPSNSSTSHGEHGHAGNGGGLWDVSLIATGESELPLRRPYGATFQNLASCNENQPHIKLTLVKYPHAFNRM